MQERIERIKSRTEETKQRRAQSDLLDPELLVPVWLVLPPPLLPPQGLGMGVAFSPVVGAPPDPREFPDNAWNGFEPKWSWAALSMGSWISRYILWRALWPPDENRRRERIQPDEGRINWSTGQQLALIKKSTKKQQFTYQGWIPSWTWLGLDYAWVLATWRDCGQSPWFGAKCPGCSAYAWSLGCAPLARNRKRNVRH